MKNFQCHLELNCNHLLNQTRSGGSVLGFSAAIFALVSALGSLGAHGSPDSVGEPRLIWKSKQVRVCWADTQLPVDSLSEHQLKRIRERNLALHLVEASTEKKQLIQSIVEQEFTPRRTGVSFIGWEPCAGPTQGTESWDLAILLGEHTQPQEAPLGLAAVGQGSTLEELQSDDQVDVSGRKSFIFLDLRGGSPNPLPKHRLELTVLHEFGHVAGLRHENARSEAATDPVCIHYSSARPMDERIGERAIMTGPYDPTSVMNYCYLSLVAKKGLRFLTASDRTIERYPQMETQIVPSQTIRSLLEMANPATAGASSVVALSKTSVSGIHSVNLRVGLSPGDLTTLRCLYLPDAPSSCNGQFSSENRP